MKSFKDLRTEAVKSADKKPETYTGPDGKAKVRIVPVDKEVVKEKTLTPAEKKKREEIAKAMERENPGMPMAKKMAIATATAKKVAEVTISPLQKIRMDKEKADRNKDDKAKTQTKRITDKQYAGYKVKMKEEAKPDAVEVMRKKQQMANISTSDRDKLAKIHAMLSKEKKNKSKNESVNLEEAADDKMKKVKQLAQLGLVGKSDVSKLMKALEDMDAGKTLNVRQKDMLIGTLNDLIGIVTGDTTTFMKAKKAVKEDIQVNEISQKKIANYISAASDSRKQKTARMADKREAGINLALKKATHKAKVNATENKDK